MEKPLLICNKIPSYYFFLVILGTILEDGQEGIISKDKLLGATKLYMELLDNDEFKDICKDFKMLLTFKYENLESELIKFLNLYQHFVYFDNEKIFLRDNVTYTMLESEIDDIAVQEGFDEFCCEVYIIRKKKAIKNYLGLKEARKMYQELIKKEKKIENAYLDLFTTQNKALKKEKVKKLLDFRNKIYKKIVDCGIHIIESFQDEEPEEDFDFEKDYPIDFALYENKFLEEDSSEELYIPLEENLATVFQLAIFSDNSLAEAKFCNDLALLHTDVYNESEFLELISEYGIDDEYERIYGTQYDSDLIFYLTYLQKLDELMTLNGEQEELAKTEIRLLYALDDTGLDLFEEENRMQVLEKLISNPNTDVIFDDGYQHFQSESLFLIQDVFEGKNRNFKAILKKVAFIATYYELSHDEKVKKVLLNYCSNEHYFEFYRFICSNAKTKKYSSYK